MSEFKNEGTRVDLGEDLLGTADLKPEQNISTGGQEAKFDSANELQRAQILFGEGLLTDARRTLWKVLRAQPESGAAQDLLQQIEAKEMQELLSAEHSKKRLGASNDEDKSKPSEVLQRLEKDLRIDFSAGELKVVPDLFPNLQDLASYQVRVLQSLDLLSAKERIDVGVAHLEMGIPEVAIEIFETLLFDEAYKVQALYLVGMALIAANKAIEATLRLEPVVRDLTLTESQKTDFLYLMGMAFEKLGDAQKAKDFYRRVHHLNPKYRNVAEKLKQG